MNRLSLRNGWFTFKTSRIITDRFRGNYVIFLNLANKIKPKDVNMKPVGLENTRISTGYGQKFPRTLSDFFHHHNSYGRNVLYFNFVNS
jgi:hypothetical protein